MIVNAQKTSERTPRTLFLVSARACSGLKHSLSAYRGLVPISPYTIPIAVTESISKYFKPFLLVSGGFAVF